ncbi:MAG: prenyltransferase [Smithellaceae bacterium]
MKYSAKELIQGWIILSRPPFHITAILPFILGTFLAYRINGAFNPEVFVLGVIGVICVMISTHHAGEYFDLAEDTIAARQHNNPFAGGTRMIPQGKMPPRVALVTSIVCFGLAAAVGLVLQFIYKTGPWTLVLGGLGALPGFFYSTEPIRLIKRGVGELFIGFCFGWLPVAASYYIQTATIAPIIHWMWMPIGFSIFNVILLNEYPDYEADEATGKRTLLCRIGKARGKAVYIAFNLLTCLTMLISPIWGVPFRVVFFYLPFVAVALFIVFSLLRNHHLDEKKLQKLCGMNIIVNLGTSLAYILAYI